MMKYMGILLMIVGTIIIIPAFMMNSAKSDTLVCERYYLGMSQPIILIFSEVSDEIENESDLDIVYVKSAFSGFSYAKYRNGEYLYLHSELTPCHIIKGDKDKIEQQMVDKFVDTLTGDGGLY